MILALLAALPLSLTQTAAPPAPTPFPTGRIVERVACLSDPSRSYALYLPSGYSTARRWPVLLVFDPGARAVLGAELFRAPAERFGWIVMSSADTRSAGVTMEFNAKAATAMLEDADRRVAGDRARYYAAGFSGGATLAWVVGRHGFVAGVIGCGGPYQETALPDKAHYDHFGATGTLDFNHEDMHEVDRVLAKLGGAHRLEVFPGRHSWMPPEMAAEAVAWLEVQAMRRGLRPRDDALAGELLAADAAQARRLEAGGALPAALRRWEAIAASFDGVADVAPARGEVARLAALPEVALELGDERKWHETEQRLLSAMAPALLELKRGDTPPTARRLAEGMLLDKIETMAQRPGREGEIGQRLLESAWSQLSVALAPELVAAGDYARLIPTLTVALRIKPERPVDLYNLACAHARAGGTREALEALARAVDAGFANRAHIESDPDLKKLRKRKEFQEIVERLPVPTPATTPTAAR